VRRRTAVTLDVATVCSSLTGMLAFRFAPHLTVLFVLTAS
jgi:hypothetical protein